MDRFFSESPLSELRGGPNWAKLGQNLNFLASVPMFDLLALMFIFYLVALHGN